MTLVDTDLRAATIDTFLSAAGWKDARRDPLAGDASRRRYIRLTDQSGQRAILMDAPPDTGEDVRPFVRIGAHLRSLSLSAPEVMAADKEDGLLLLEDLGDALYTRVVDRHPGTEAELYAAAIDVLVALHAQSAPADLPAYGPAVMAPLAALAADWYLPGMSGARRDPNASRDLANAVEASLEVLAPETPMLALRDYHAENLIWLPARHGAARVGLLDFQDGMAGHAAYDLVSLLEDARRDVPPTLAKAMTARYMAATGQDQERFTAAAAVLSAQRNLRIIGVFARLSLHFGKPHYVDFLPRVWAHLQNDLAHPALSDLARVVSDLLPSPDPAGLARLRYKAGTWPMP
ncbi:MAG: phosphotransferase [Pseudomonadota bacterium]